MKLSEIINKLTELKDKYGNLPVMTYNLDFEYGAGIFDLDENQIQFYAKTKELAKKYKFPIIDTKFRSEMDQLDEIKSEVSVPDVAILIGS